MLSLRSSRVFSADLAAVGLRALSPLKGDILAPPSPPSVISDDPGSDPAGGPIAVQSADGCWGRARKMLWILKEIPWPRARWTTEVSNYEPLACVGRFHGDFTDARQKTLHAASAWSIAVGFRHPCSGKNPALQVVILTTEVQQGVEVRV